MTCGVELRPKQSRVRRRRGKREPTHHTPLCLRVVLQPRSLCAVCRRLRLHGLADHPGGGEGSAEKRPGQRQSSPVGRKQVRVAFTFEASVNVQDAVLRFCMCVCVQRGGHRRPPQRGPCGRAAGGSGSHRGPSARPVRLRLVLGQQAVPLHGLRGRGQLRPDRDHQERHQVRETVNVVIKM